MTSPEILSIEPEEVKFTFELKKQISCPLQLLNKTDNHVAFKVKTTNPKKYCVRPNTGVVLPKSTCDIIVTMQAQREAPPDLQCKDKFLLQSVVANAGATAKDINPEMFNKDAGNVIDERKLRVVYVALPRPPSPINEEFEEDSSVKGPNSDNGNVNYSDFSAVSKASAEPQEKSSEAKTLILKLTEEKNAAIQQAKRLRQDLELMKRESNKSKGGVPFLYVLIIGLLGIFLGYMLKKT